MAHTAIVDAPIPSEEDMQALQVTSFISIGCIIGMSLLYGEIILLQKN